MNPVKTLKFLHLALLSGQVVFLAVVLILTKGKLTMDFSFEEPIAIVACLLAGITLFAHRFFFQKLLEKIKASDTLTSKLQQYQSASIVKWGLIEGSTLLCIVGALITKNGILLAIAGVLVVVFYTLKPSREQLFIDLTLSKEEKEQIKG